MLCVADDGLARALPVAQRIAALHGRRLVLVPGRPSDRRPSLSRALRGLARLPSLVRGRSELARRVLASAWEHDLLVLARRPRASTPTLVSRLGPLVKAIFESSRAPVLLLPERAVRLPAAPPLFRTVLAAVDFSDSSTAVAELARRLGGPPARLVLLHVLRDFPGEYAHGLHHFAPAGLEAERKSVAAGGLERLDRGERVERIVRSGAPAHEIARLAGRLPADLVVLGRPSRSRTVSQVARTSRCPLLVVPPRRPARGAWFGSGPRDRPRGSRAVE